MAGWLFDYSKHVDGPNVVNAGRKHGPSPSG